jgi:hypothetical protein
MNRMYANAETSKANPTLHKSPTIGSNLLAADAYRLASSKQQPTLPTFGRHVLAAADYEYDQSNPQQDSPNFAIKKFPKRGKTNSHFDGQLTANLRIASHRIMINDGASEQRLSFPGYNMTGSRQKQFTAQKATRVSHHLQRGYESGRADENQHAGIDHQFYSDQISFDSHRLGRKKKIRGTSMSS